MYLEDILLQSICMLVFVCTLYMGGGGGCIIKNVWNGLLVIHMGQMSSVVLRTHECN